MIRYVQDTSEPAWKGYFYALLMFVVSVARSLILHQYFHRCFLVGLRIRTGVISAVYKKVKTMFVERVSFTYPSPPLSLSLNHPQTLSLSNKARRTSTVGEIVNLMSVDAQRFMDLTPYLHIIWSGPLQIVLALIFLYKTMGPSIFAGFGVTLLLIPVNAIVATFVRQLQMKQMVKKDIRIKLVNEILNGIKVLLY